MQLYNWFAGHLWIESYFLAYAKKLSIENNLIKLLLNAMTLEISCYDIDDLSLISRDCLGDSRETKY